ncbi:MAG: Exonuclease RNase and polymerase [Sphingobacterium multivorum]|jgi:DNA polymerase-3 subunit epsilon|nr:Exonuclease RNase and polymerase [Sphingobacterium multivorum]
MNFIVLNFDTATEYRNSICQIELSIVQNNKVTETKKWLIKPNSYPFLENTYENGITAEMVKDSPEFDIVWKEIKPILENQLIVTHNAGFHISALRKVLDYYELEYPTFNHFCTSIVAKKTNPYIGIYVFDYLVDSFNIHKKSPKTVQIAEITKRILKDFSGDNIEDYLQSIGVDIGYFKNPNKFIPCLTKRTYVKKEDKYGLKDLPTDSSTHNPDSIFYGAEVVFTGTLVSMQRKEAVKKISMIGGIPSDSLKTTTNYLVCSNDDVKNMSPDKMTGKYKKAISFAAKGHDIEIIDELTFLENI